MTVDYTCTDLVGVASCVGDAVIGDEGRLRQILEGRADVRVVGDRFVFQSEVLFEAGEADVTQVVEHLRPEARVDHVHRRVVDAADVEVDRVPVVDRRALERRLEGVPYDREALEQALADGVLS